MVKKPTGSKGPKTRPPSQSSAQKKKSPRAGEEVGAAPWSNIGRRSSHLGLGTATQQLILNVFSETFRSQLSSRDTFAAVLQEVKQALFERDFLRAFGSELYLGVYAARYSPTRALCYAEVLSGIVSSCSETEKKQVDSAGPPDVPSTADAGEVTAAVASLSANPPPPPPRSPIRMVSIGGGAAELVAFAACLRHQRSQSRKQEESGFSSLTLLDSGPWGSVITSLTKGLTTPPQLSTHASVSAIASNSAFIEASDLSHVSFREEDVLSMSKEGLADVFSFQPGCQSQQTAPRDHRQEHLPLHLVTLFFTLNELFTSGGMGRTTAFLLGLTDAVPPGTLLLVLDSPGSYSETVVGKQSRKYPMHWLLEKVLLSPAVEETDDGKAATAACWDKIESHDSLWFRLPETPRYPIPLEDMRYQMHLYRRVTTAEPDET